ncbi:MAG: rRNA maturation RNase YbeY [Bacteroidales bacterium]|nr:rRNA maturation RNase YbeY [Bacteroidales bacterium]
MVSWFLQDIDFKLKNKIRYGKWLTQTTLNKGRKLKALAVIFCSDSYLLDMNRRFLGHDYYTDVLTFDANAPQEWPEKTSGGIEGDIFISIDRVREHAILYNVPFNEELARVMAHGLLHLLGYKDNTHEEQEIMNREEDAALRMLMNI